jgi:hypothetical protein
MGASPSTGSIAQPPFSQMSELEKPFDAHDVIVNLNRTTSNRDPAF